MRNFLIRLLVNAAALSAAAWVVSGIQLTGGFGDILIVALVFGVLNAVLKPVLVFFSIPFIIVTLGFFALVVNGALLLITASLTDHLAVAGLGSAMLGSIVISLVTMFLGRALEDGEER
jgi:putative membrane protein